MLLLFLLPRLLLADFCVSWFAIDLQLNMKLRISPCDLMSVVRDVANRARNDMKPSVKFSVVSSRDLPQQELMLDQLHLKMVSGAWDALDRVHRIVVRMTSLFELCSCLV